ncbi:MAG: putative transcriptional regulator [Sulfurimonas sp.]|jgi:predicted transcriptional regulator
MRTNFEELIPARVLFNLKEVEELGVLKIDMAKKLIYKGKLEVVKIGSKLHISRSEIIRFLEYNLVPTNVC